MLVYVTFILLLYTEYRRSRPAYILTGLLNSRWFYTCCVAAQCSQYNIKSSKACCEKLKPTHVAEKGSVDVTGRQFEGVHQFFRVSHYFLPFDVRSKTGFSENMITQYSIRSDVSFVEAKMPLLL